MEEEGAPLPCAFSSDIFSLRPTEDSWPCEARDERVSWAGPDARSPTSRFPTSHSARGKPPRKSRIVVASQSQSLIHPRLRFDSCSSSLEDLISPLEGVFASLLREGVQSISVRFFCRFFQHSHPCKIRLLSMPE
jgi:hypothetical protein